MNHQYNNHTVICFLLSAFSHNDFVAILDLPEGEHQYKFFVDGQWVHDPSEVNLKAISLLPETLNFPLLVCYQCSSADSLNAPGLWGVETVYTFFSRLVEILCFCCHSSSPWLELYGPMTFTSHLISMADAVALTPHYGLFHLIVSGSVASGASPCLGLLPSLRFCFLGLQVQHIQLHWACLSHAGL